MSVTPRTTMRPGDRYWVACARHQTRTTTRNLADLLLCDGCVARLVSECFNDRPPVYSGEYRSGYCGLCNARTVVAHRQWFICLRCLPVVRSYHKAAAASQFVHAFWQEGIQPQCPQLRLEETDPVRLEAFVQGRRTQKAKAVSVEGLDFTVWEQSPAGGEQPACHVELNAGPSSLEEMTEFQLDVNDFIDIQTATRKTGLPVYVFHVQVVEEYDLPTSRSVAARMWWTDILSLRRHLKSVRQRRGEEKKAGYYRPTAFKPAEAFVEEFVGGRCRELRRQIAVEGIPDLPV